MFTAKVHYNRARLVGNKLMLFIEIMILWKGTTDGVSFRAHVVALLTISVTLVSKCLYTVCILLTRIRCNTGLYKSRSAFNGMVDRKDVTIYSSVSQHFCHGGVPNMVFVYYDEPLHTVWKCLRAERKFFAGSVSVATGKVAVQQYGTYIDTIQSNLTLNTNWPKPYKEALGSAERLLLYCQLVDKNFRDISLAIWNFSRYLKIINL
jgi:hypothetical protein